MRTFVLQRISKLMLTKHHFTPDSGFSIQKYFGDSFGMLRGEGSHKVRIEFNADASDQIRERFWHVSQKLTEKPGNIIEMELHVSHLDEVMHWVLGWGGDAKVLEPRVLIEEIAVLGRKLTNIHSQP